MITVFQVGGLDAACSTSIPRAYGIDQTVGDTLEAGRCVPGQLRTVEALREVADAMLDICPDAWLLATRTRCR